MSDTQKRRYNLKGHSRKEISEDAFEMISGEQPVAMNADADIKVYNYSPNLIQEVADVLHPASIPTYVLESEERYFTASDKDVQTLLADFNEENNSWKVILSPEF